MIEDNPATYQQIIDASVWSNYTIGEWAKLHQIMVSLSFIDGF